ncbi:MAG: extracellular solute-binding protein [Chloroflexi bacterium]|nr:extracellular solute-binding protein [Chloroflexota bacterium]
MQTPVFANRRKLLKLVIGGTAATLLLAACAPAPAPTATPAPRPTEAPKPAAAAPTPTPAPVAVATPTAAPKPAAPTTAPTPAPKPTAPPTQAAAKPSGPITIRWATLSGEGNPYLENPRLAAREFVARNPGVTVNVEPTAGDYKPKLVADLAAGTLADIFFSHSGLIQVLADAGITRSMDPYFLAAKGDELKKKDFYPFLIAAGSTAKGETHLLGMGADAMTMHYNKGMLKEAGLPEPKNEWTWPQFYDYARKLTKKSADGRVVERWGAGLRNTWAGALNGPIYSAGGDWIKITGGKQEFPCTTPEFIKGLKYCWDGVKERIFANEDDIKAMGDVHAAFVNGKLAIVSGARWSAPVLRKATFDWDSVAEPRDVRYGVGAGTAGWSMAVSTKNPDMVWKLVQHIFSEEGYKPWVANYAVVPTLVRLRDSSIWRNLAPPPYNNDAYIVAIKNAYLRPRGVAYEDGGFIDKQFADAYQRYVKENVSIEDAAKTMKAKFDDFLKDNPATVVEWNPGAEF